MMVALCMIVCVCVLGSGMSIIFKTSKSLMETAHVCEIKLYSLTKQCVSWLWTRILFGEAGYRKDGYILKPERFGFNLQLSHFPTV